MKRRTTFLGLVLALALVFGMSQAVFAAFPDDGIETIQKIKDEVSAETYCDTFAKEVVDGKYGLVTTAELKNAIDSGEKMIVVDTMPAGWYAQRHVPTAVNAEAGHDGKVRFSDFDAAQKAALMNQVKAKAGTKKVTYYWNTKTKKWQTKKPAKKYLGKCSKKKDKHYNKKKYSEKVVNKDVKVVTYCGFVGCARSHEAAKFLVEQGFTNVYRYAGGISAWVDAKYPVEGTDAAK